VKKELVTVVDAQVHGNENNFSHFTGGFIQLEGRSGPLFPTFLPDFVPKGEWTNGHYTYEVVFDVEPISEEGLHYMPLAICDKNGYTPIVECVMLRLVDQENSLFARMGLVSVSLEPEADLPHELRWAREFAQMDRSTCEDLAVITII
jgi:hypothetical protein